MSGRCKHPQGCGDTQLEGGVLGEDHEARASGAEWGRALVRRSSSRAEWLSESESGSAAVRSLTHLLHDAAAPTVLTRKARPRMGCLDTGYGRLDPGSSPGAQAQVRALEAPRQPPATMSSLGHQNGRRGKEAERQDGVPGAAAGFALTLQGGFLLVFPSGLTESCLGESRMCPFSKKLHPGATCPHILLFPCPTGGVAVGSAPPPPGWLGVQDSSLPSLRKAGVAVTQMAQGIGQLAPSGNHVAPKRRLCDTRKDPQCRPGAGRGWPGAGQCHPGAGRGVSNSTQRSHTEKAET